jgi:hypothetical protein
MNTDYDFLLLKINELERKVFELEMKVNSFEKANNDSITLDEEIKINTRIERYLFNGNVYKKSKLVLAVIKQYVVDHPNINASELIEAFPSKEFKLSTFSCVIELANIPSKHLNPVKRYFVSDDLVITLKDGTKVAVCTQWGTNINLFIDFVKKYGYEIVLSN